MGLRALLVVVALSLGCAERAELPGGLETLPVGAVLEVELTAEACLIEEDRRIAIHKTELFTAEISPRAPRLFGLSGWGGTGGSVPLSAEDVRLIDSRIAALRSGRAGPCPTYYEEDLLLTWKLPSGASVSERFSGLGCDSSGRPASIFPELVLRTVGAGGPPPLANPGLLKVAAHYVFGWR